MDGLDLETVFDGLEEQPLDHSKRMSIGHYWIAKSILVLAFQMARIADNFVRVIHRGALLTERRGGR